MNGSLTTVLGSIIEVFGLVLLAYLYARRARPDLSELLRVGMNLFLPCLTFTAILDSRLATAEVRDAVLATLIQIGIGLLVGWLGLRFVGWKDKRELLVPIAFVNSANLLFPLLLANFGSEALSRGVICYMITNLTIFSVGLVLLHGVTRLRETFGEPALWASVIAVCLRALDVHPPDIVMRIPRLAGLAAVPVMLVLFGDTLSRARLRSAKEAVVATGLRYLSGALGLALVLVLIRPEGILRKVLILYAVMPSAVVGVMLTQRAGRDAEAVASTVLLATLLAVVILPIVLLAIR